MLPKFTKVPNTYKILIHLDIWIADTNPISKWMKMTLFDRPINNFQSIAERLFCDRFYNI